MTDRNTGGPLVFSLTDRALIINPSTGCFSNDVDVDVDVDVGRKSLGFDSVSVSDSVGVSFTVAGVMTKAYSLFHGPITRPAEPKMES